MAQTVTVSRNDTITKILTSQKGIKINAVHAWLSKMKQINPHISDLNCIYPGEKILIPDSIHETVSRHQIWTNAFSKIPPSIDKVHRGNTALYIANGSETIDWLADRAFAGVAGRSLPHSIKRAVIIHNNPVLEQCLGTNRAALGMVVNLSPVKLSEYDKAYWNQESSKFVLHLNQFDSSVQDLYQQAGPDDTLLVAQMAQNLKNSGASIGTDDVVRGLGYGCFRAGFSIDHQQAGR